MLGSWLGLEANVGGSDHRCHCFLNSQASLLLTQKKLIIKRQERVREINCSALAYHFGMGKTPTKQMKFNNVRQNRSLQVSNSYLLKI